MHLKSEVMVLLVGFIVTMCLLVTNVYLKSYMQCAYHVPAC